jgi:hypothetical protein
MSQPNVKFSANCKKYGAPPSRVVIGGVLRIEFNPIELIKGIYLPNNKVKLLVNNVPGFKRIVKKG